MKNGKKMILFAAALASLALFTGCTSASAVSADEAKDLVRQTVGDPAAVVVELESDRDDGVYELEVIVDGVHYEYEVDSATGQLREVEREGDIRTAATVETKPVETTPVETQPIETIPAETAPAETAPAVTEPERITLEEAKAIAYAHAGVNEADAYDRSSERDDGVYEIDFEYDGWEYEYDISYDGKILKSHKDRDDDYRPAATQPAETQPTETKPAETKPAATKSDRISRDKALSIAMDHAGVSSARDRDVEWDDGRWEVSFESGEYEYDYDISADGTILRWEKEHDHEDHDHDHHD